MSVDVDRSSSTRKSQKQAAKLSARSTKTLQRYVQTPEYCLVRMCVGGCVGATVCISVPSTKTLQRFLRMDVCTYSYLYFTYIRRRCTYAYLYACMCACACVQTYMHTCVRAPYIHTYIHAYMLTYTQTCIHTCTHTCTHTHTHTFMQDAGEVGSSWGGGEARTAVGVAAADKLDLGTAAENSFSDDDPACVE